MAYSKPPLPNRERVYDSAVTPITRKGLPFRRTHLPSGFSSPNSCSAGLGPRMHTGCSISALVKKRPRASWCGRIWNHSGVVPRISAASAQRSPRLAPPATNIIGATRRTPTSERTTSISLSRRVLKPMKLMGLNGFSGLMRPGSTITRFTPSDSTCATTSCRTPFASETSTTIAATPTIIPSPLNSVRRGVSHNDSSAAWKLFMPKIRILG
ncbi:MAG: hypothetical protein KatS3mg021_0678 [Fimbriimonadales bacterium]|nr:MAG: hypothetical protein KatS3mg021_0678 [Fimbriimonadales bacterium]